MNDPHRFKKIHNDPHRSKKIHNDPKKFHNDPLRPKVIHNDPRINRKRFQTTYKNLKYLITIPDYPGSTRERPTTIYSDPQRPTTIQNN